MPKPSFARITPGHINLDGKLRGAPAMTRNEGFCRDQYKLPQVRCEEWLGWVFVCLDPNAAPVAEQLSDVALMIAGYDMTNYSEAFYEEPCLGHQLEGSGRELHGKLSSAGVPRGHDRRFVEAGGYDLSARWCRLQLSHDPQG